MSSWYLVQCKPHHARRAEQHLCNQKFECFLPLHHVRRKRGNTLQWAAEPMFPNYLFLRMDENSNWRAIRSTRGVAKVVSFNGLPAKVSEEVVNALRQRCAAMEQEKAGPVYKPGDKACITEGCFKDIEAIIQAVRGEERVVLLLNLLNRTQTVEVPLASIRYA